MHAFQGTIISLIHARPEVIYYRIDSRFAMSCHALNTVSSPLPSAFLHCACSAICISLRYEITIIHHACCRARKAEAVTVNGITINNLFDTHSSPGIKTVNIDQIQKHALGASQICIRNLASCLVPLSSPVGPHLATLMHHESKQNYFRFLEA
jgi:hypothetical protein